MSNSISLSQVRQRLYSAVVCDALDELGFDNQAVRTPLPAVTVAGVLVGRCKTTLWGDLYHPDPEPYALELRAVDECRPDDLFVAAAGGSLHSAVWGELLSTAAGNRGCVGAVVDGAVRDTVRMREMNFPVYARGVLPYDSRNRQRVVDIDVRVQIGGVTIQPGDLLIADADGIVVVPQSVEPDALQAAWKKATEENTVRDAIRKGLSARAAFDRYGVL